MEETLPITPEIFKTFKRAKVFTGEKYQKKPISSLDFDDTGDFCVTCSAEEENISLYNCVRGRYLHQNS
jgi:COMPASS component SWD2